MKTIKKLLGIFFAVAFAFVIASCGNEKTSVPTSTPTSEPTSTPTSAPTSTPTSTPTSAPTSTPTSAPTSTPTSTPTTHTHNFVNGKCECGEVDPNYVPPHTHKFIDGVCECGEQFVAPVSGWTLVNEIKDGDNVLIAAPAYNKLLSANKVTATSFYNKGVDYNVNNFDNVTNAEIFVVTANADGSYTFTSLTGVVIALADSYSSLNNDGANKSWKLEEKTTGVFYLKNTVRGNYLEWYDSKGNWSTYNTQSLSDLFEISFYTQVEATDVEHVHNHISTVHNATCTEAGYTSFECRCGDAYTETGAAALEHNYTAVVTAPTCTEQGYTTYTCANDASHTYVADYVDALGHKYVDGSCACGEVDPNAHVHNYAEEVIAPTCTAVGYTKHTCSCGDTYNDNEVAMLEHVDTNLDITCDYEGCTKRILPAADSKISLFTANNMIIISLSSSYYVEGVVIEVVDANNGIFIIADEAGDTILIRLPKNADGAAYTTWPTKVVLGDTISVYGKPTRNTSTTTNQTAKVEGGILTVLKHDHVFSEPNCVTPATCICLATDKPALGHIDENTDNACDRCSWNMKLKTTSIAISTDTTATNGVLADDKTSWTWSNDEFDVIVAKGTSTSTLYTTSKAYMQLKKLNTLTVNNKNGYKIHSVIISATNATQFGNLKDAIGTVYKYTENETDFSITITLDSTENFVLTNNGKNTAYVENVEIVYEIPTSTDAE